MDVRVKRVYAPPAPDDGLRVLVDRIWPRGISKADAAVDLWLKDVAPSTELRQWFGHETERMAEFTVRYTAELDASPAAAELRGLAADHDRITLVYSAHDERHNQAVVLAAYLVGAGSD
ncbi:hypothetical protein DDP54_12985 [Cellulomonas sp. WB94]|uniref:DUF488 domain-containing protein n=1 Tax=Cellulomonas sp. WB94 TaxID=2173174 RepID=UPI000D567031|nr:DUF488 domain-containing protein [Cellulomonas sp. WB94]PVU83754.1 hypothetical protein DDP54_12985 [Cellulomonas sp. WB94]